MKSIKVLARAVERVFFSASRSLSSHEASFDVVVVKSVVSAPNANPETNNIPIRKYIAFMIILTLKIMPITYLSTQKRQVTYMLHKYARRYLG
jgi:hypothetical protein